MRTMLLVGGLFLSSTLSVLAQPRPKWDQEKAAEKVKQIIALEKSGKPWDAIPWLTDVDAAVKKAQKEQKPLFVYFFLKKNVGPAAAPC